MSKPGWRTTEFWFALAASVAPHLMEAVPNGWKAVAGAVAAGLYALSRGMAKRNAPPAPNVAP